ncbi:MAG: DUF3592 domain-containing protein [Lachnospiraceae bacterium]|nr:DUF3592 domain-containing protein [Lachnospiraceae bacterium]
MLIAGYIVLGIGVLFILLGIIFFFVGKAVWKRCGRTEGKIIDMCYNAYSYNHGGNGKQAIGISTGNRSIKTQCPIFLYYVDGVEYKRADNVARNRGQIKRSMNQTHTVYYNLDNPEDASLIGKSIFSVIGIVFVPIGVVMLVISLVLLVIGI